MELGSDATTNDDSWETFLWTCSGCELRLGHLHFDNQTLLRYACGMVYPGVAPDFSIPIEVLVSPDELKTPGKHRMEDFVDKSKEVQDLLCIECLFTRQKALGEEPVGVSSRFTLFSSELHRYFPSLSPKYLYFESVPKRWPTFLHRCKQCQSWQEARYFSNFCPYKPQAERVRCYACSVGLGYTHRGKWIKLYSVARSHALLRRLKRWHSMVLLHAAEFGDALSVAADVAESASLCLKFEDFKGPSFTGPTKINLLRDLDPHKPEPEDLLFMEHHKAIVEAYKRSQLPKGELREECDFWDAHANQIHDTIFTWWPSILNHCPQDLNFDCEIEESRKIRQAKLELAEHREQMYG